MLEKLQSMIIKRARLMAMIEECNATCQFKRAEILQEKLEMLEHEIDLWNLQVYGNKEVNQ